ncbi:hypothetical protein [Rossellomorea marisflavi]|uniref:hypothetical protein n=1 Tax=Rossellomorea marisflavi TaxID=189381 RepID=UPI003FA0A39B
MLATSFKQKVDRVLQKRSARKSTQSKGRIKGLPNVTHGYSFQKQFDEYHVYFRCGNMTMRGMTVEEMDKETMKLYEILKADGFEEQMELDTYGYQLSIKLLHEKA